MATLRSTVIMKTDICGFTSRVKNLLKSELANLLNQHKNFISEIAAKHEGSIVKGEGDSFWLTFPSVTAAALAGIEMQQELRAIQSGKSDSDRLAIRISITLGDVLHQDRDIFGDSVNLTARIESVTPPDEIYLSQAAWLAVNKAEVKTSFVNEFTLKGMSEQEKVYKIEQIHKTRIIKNQVIVITDLTNFIAYQESHSIENVEQLITQLDSFIKEVCIQYGGTIRLIIADGYFLTFPESQLALIAIEKLCQSWAIFVQQYQKWCFLRIGINKGDLYIFRSCIYGEDINIASMLEWVSGRIVDRDKARNSVVISELVKHEVEGTCWEDKLRKIEKEEIYNQLRDLSTQKYWNQYDAYQLI